MARKFIFDDPATINAIVLQCDRAFDGAEIMDKETGAAPLVKLQCDRAFDGAEMPARQLLALRGFIASM